MTLVRVTLGFTGTYEIPDDPDAMYQIYGHTDLLQAIEDDQVLVPEEIMDMCEDGTISSEFTVVEDSFV